MEIPQPSNCYVCGNPEYKCPKCDIFSICETCFPSTMRGHPVICRPTFSEKVRAYAELLEDVYFTPSDLSVSYTKRFENHTEHYRLNNGRYQACAICSADIIGIKEILTLTPTLLYKRCDTCSTSNRILCPNTYADRNICIDNLQSTITQFLYLQQFTANQNIPRDVLIYLAKTITTLNNLCICGL